jgi:hypothetical protein
MDWIDEAFAKLERIESGQYASDSAALFQNLWKEIVRQVEKINAKGRRLFTNGAANSRVVATSPPFKNNSHLPIPEDFPKREECRITLSGEKISVESQPSQRVNLTFDIAEKSDHVLYLILNGQEIEPRDAAGRILKPFVFPELK